MNPGMTVAKGATISEGTPKVVRVMAAIGTVKTMLQMKKNRFNSRFICHDEYPRH